MSDPPRPFNLEDTPPEGTELPSEPPTEPEPRVRCPECQGQGYRLNLTRWPEQHKASAKRCDLCKRTGKVDRATFVRWRSSRVGRAQS
jgi:hypothetical protein